MDSGLKDSLTARAAQLQNGVTIGVFLAASQAQTLAYSIGNYTTHLELSINALAFIGLVCTINGSWLAYATSSEMLSITTDIQKFLDGVKNRPNDSERLARFVDQVRAWKPRKSRALKPVERLMMEAVIRILMQKELNSQATTSNSLEMMLHSTTTPNNTNVNNSSSYLRLSTLTQIIQEGEPELDFDHFLSIHHKLELNRSLGHVSQNTISTGFFCFWASIICIAVATGKKQIWITAVVASFGIYVYMGLASYRYLERREDAS